MNDDARQVAQAIIDRIDDAWEHEGMVPPDAVTEDALYTNMAGRFFRGRSAIVEGTRLVKETLKTRVTQRELIEARKLSDGVILALVRATAWRPEGAARVELPGYQLYLVVWDNDAWRVAAYQATRIAGTNS